MHRIVSLLITLSLACGTFNAQTLITMPVKQNPPFEVSVKEVFLEFVAPSITIGGDVVVTGGSGSYSYRWYSGSDKIGDDALLTIEEAGVYDLYIDDTCDCVQRVSFIVTPSSVEGVGTDFAGVYPNPVDDRLVISGIKAVQVNILSIAGQLESVYADFGDEEQIELNVSALPAGDHIVNIVTSEHKVVTKKIVKK